MDRDKVIEMILDPDRRPAEGSAEHQAFLAYLAKSPECRAMYEQQEALWEALDLWEPIEPSAEFDQRLYQRIERSRENGIAAAWGWPSRPLEWITAARSSAGPSLAWTLAALLLVASGIVSYQPRSGPDGVAARAPRLVEAEFVEQIDQTLDDIEMLADFEALVLEAGGQGKS